MFVFGKKCWRKADSFFVLLRNSSSRCTSYIFRNGKKLAFGSGEPFYLIEKFISSEEGEKVGYLSYNLSEFVEKIDVGENDLHSLPYSIIAKVSGSEIFQDFSDSNEIYYGEGEISGGDKNRISSRREFSYSEISVGRKIGKNSFEAETSPEIKSSFPEDKRVFFDDRVFREVFTSSNHKQVFISNIREIKRRIYMGDVYQVNISRRIEIEHKNTGDFVLNFFRRYTRNQPVGFPAFFDFSDFGFFLVSGSMELFLEKRGNVIRSAPIKGTRRVGGMNYEDISRAISELKNSEKERAENLMIVDMVRNDLGKFCVPGSVKVKRLFDVEVYSTLIHLVSEVEGVIKDRTSLSSILKATFPPASVTGAPKKSAMQIIEKLERKRRGPYCGAICYFDENGDFTMSVAIRISLFSSDKIFYWTGCGIVWDSDEESEWEESITKTIAFAKSLFPLS